MLRPFAALCLMAGPVLTYTPDLRMPGQMRRC